MIPLLALSLTLAPLSLALGDNVSPKAPATKPAASAAAKPAPAGYRLIRTDGTTFLIRSYEAKGIYYVTRDKAGKVVQHAADSVKSIEPLDQAGLETATVQLEEERAAKADSSSGGRRSARTSTRTQARISSPRYAMPSFSEEPVYSPPPKTQAEPPASTSYAGSSSLGTTPTGL